VSATDETTNQQKAYTAESFKLYLDHASLSSCREKSCYKSTNILLTSTVWGWGTSQLTEIEGTFKLGRRGGQILVVNQYNT